MRFNQMKISLVFSILLLFIFCWTAYEALQFAELARYFPLYVSVLGITLVVIELISSIVKNIKNPGNKTEFHPQLKEAFKYILWIVSFLLLIYIVGFKIATAIFLLSFLILESKFKLVKALLSVAAVIFFLIIFGDYYMNLNWPDNLLNL